MKEILTATALMITAITLLIAIPSFSQTPPKSPELSSDTVGLLHQLYGALDKDIKSGKVETLIYRDSRGVGFISVTVDRVVIFRTFR